MEDVRDVSAELHRLAEAEHLDPIDTAALLQRGRRGRRRRMLFAAAGTAVCVAAVAVGATLLPHLTAADDRPPVAGASSDFSPVPGVPRGEESANQTLTKAEAARRCALRYPENKGSLAGATYQSGRATTYDLKKGDKFAMCLIPGGDKPSAALVAAAEQDPVPATTAGQLRNCSVQLWVDVTKWRVVAVDRQQGYAATVIAISPSGRKVAACELQRPRTIGKGLSLAPSSMVVTLDQLGPLDPVIPGKNASGYTSLHTSSSSGSGASCTATRCKSWKYQGWGRTESNVTKVRIQLPGDPEVHDVKVTDGWYAVAWLKSSYNQAHPYPKLIAYDRTGKVVKTMDS